MSDDDLVKRLRAEGIAELDEAADRIEHLEDRCANLLVENGILNNRIEKLEAALREIAALGYWDGDSAISIARKALEGKENE